MLSSVYLVEYTLYQNLMIEIHTRNFDLHITVPSPNLAFFCAETWTISPIQSIIETWQTIFKDRNKVTGNIYRLPYFIYDDVT